jgi:carbonic anhydrase
MGAIDDALRANARYAERFAHGGLPARPRRGLAVVACMDARLDVFRALGLEPGDAHVIRNAGGVVTEDVLRSLIVSHHLGGTREVVVINHTDCAMLTVKDDELAARLLEATGRAPVAPARFHGFTDLRENVRRQVLAVRSHPWLPPTITVRGFVYDVGTGRLAEVEG